MVFHPESNQDFINAMARAGAHHAYKNNLPLPAMLGCACEESGFGTSPIYNLTGCPFNLQRPKDWTWPECVTMDRPTNNKEGEKAKPAPFCVAKDLAEAARLWCEWILHWPNKKPRDALLLFRDNPKEFARNLYLVGFAESSKAKTEKYVKVIEQNHLLDYDAVSVVEEEEGLE